MEGLLGSKAIPPGFRFHPTDEELFMYYLKRKVMGKPLKPEMISDVDVYHFLPWDLPNMASLKTRDLYWFFFCPRFKKYPNGGRANRATEGGYWKSTGNDRVVNYHSRPVGKIKTLVFHRGKAPKGERTDWVMHEYRLEDKDLAERGVSQDSYVICKIYEKSGLGPKNGEDYGARFIEEEWESDDDNAHGHGSVSELSSVVDNPNVASPVGTPTNAVPAAVVGTPSTASAAAVSGTPSAAAAVSGTPSTAAASVDAPYVTVASFGTPDTTAASVGAPNVTSAYVNFSTAIAESVGMCWNAAACAEPARTSSSAVTAAAAAAAAPAVPVPAPAPAPAASASDEEEVHRLLSYCTEHHEENNSDIYGDIYSGLGDLFSPSHNWNDLILEIDDLY
ncbi:NAC domain-containing protein 78 [Bienertia sinuspersici]